MGINWPGRAWLLAGAIAVATDPVVGAGVWTAEALSAPINSMGRYKVFIVFFVLGI